MALAAIARRVWARRRSAGLAALAFAVVLGISLAAQSVAKPSRPVTLSKEAAAAALKDIETDRADTQKWLQSDSERFLYA